MRVLLTGSSGWLGRTLKPMLDRRGYTTLGLDPAPGEHTDIVASVADRDALDRLFRANEFDAVIHAGALHKPDIARFSQQAFVDVNVTGTLNLLELAARRPGTRFVFTSTTSLMISQAIREDRAEQAVWLDESAGPLEPRNIYGVTKLAGEGLCRQHHIEHGLPVVVLRTARFFPEEDDTLTGLSGPNLKANEILNRRATVRDMARAHVRALEAADRIGFGLYVVSAPTPFEVSDLRDLRTDARKVIARRFPEAEALYRRIGWSLPASLGRVYDGRLICAELGFEYETDFAAVLGALDRNEPSPVEHDPDYVSPLVANGLAP